MATCQVFYNNSFSYTIKRNRREVTTTYDSIKHLILHDKVGLKCEPLSFNEIHLKCKYHVNILTKTVPLECQPHSKMIKTSDRRVVIYQTKKGVSKLTRDCVIKRVYITHSFTETRAPCGTALT